MFVRARRVVPFAAVVTATTNTNNSIDNDQNNGSSNPSLAGGSKHHVFRIPEMSTVESVNLISQHLRKNEAFKSIVASKEQRAASIEVDYSKIDAESLQGYLNKVTTNATIIDREIVMDEIIKRDKLASNEEIALYSVCTHCYLCTDMLQNWHKDCLPSSWEFQLCLSNSLKKGNEGNECLPFFIKAKGCHMLKGENNDEKNSSNSNE